MSNPTEGAEDQRYNGWTNYETWNVALWLDNDEGTYTMVRERAADLKRDAAMESGTFTSARYELAEWLKERGPAGHRGANWLRRASRVQ